MDGRCTSSYLKSWYRWTVAGTCQRNIKWPLRGCGQGHMIHSVLFKEICSPIMTSISPPWYALGDKELKIASVAGASHVEQLLRWLYINILKRLKVMQLLVEKLDKTQHIWPYRRRPWRGGGIRGNRPDPYNFSNFPSRWSRWHETLRFTVFEKIAVNSFSMPQRRIMA